MIVNQFCTYLSGGASIAAQRLHRSLRTAGVDSRFWYAPHCKTSSSDAFVRRLRWPASENLAGRFYAALTWVHRRIHGKWNSIRHLRRRPSGFEIFTPARMPNDTRYELGELPGDILHLHWVSKLIDVPSFFASVPDELPIVWTLHDMNPFTGGCHFSSGCEAYRMACGNCPQIACPTNTDLSYQQLALKRDAVCNKNLHIVAPSRWLTEAARQSSILAGARAFHTIPYGLDTDALSPQSRSAVRQQLQIPQDAFVLGFGADSVTNRRKGWRELLAALKEVHSPRSITALVFGSGKLPEEMHHRVNVVEVGYVEGPERIANLYSAMNVLVLPSLEDNLPQTGLEAMACGTPVIAFDTGGIPDFVIPGQTGWLARRGDAADLARKIQRLVDHPQEIDSMRNRSRELIEERFNRQTEAASYVALYRDILAERQSRPLQAA